MCIAFMPFSTAILAGYLKVGGAESNIAAALYTGTLAMAGLMFNLVWRYATYGYRLVDRNLSRNSCAARRGSMA
jgi:uncharacterized membrane protein